MNFRFAEPMVVYSYTGKVKNY